MSHGYERGRLDLPFVGHCTFGKRPPAYDPGGVTSILAAQVLMNFLGFIFAARRG
ncbi:MAG: hypothetical protein KDF64_20885 [Geminicoccaceae bacterium]|nr:hypothetical protein [Geminicoccaceae bacterium]